MNSIHQIINNFIVDTTTGCWLYQGEIDPSVGYGRVMIDGRRIHVHRLVAFLELGLDLNNNKQFACHKRECPNRSCINPLHLYVGDNQSNQLDVIQDKCKRGHDLIGNNVRINTRKDGRTFRTCKICANVSNEKTKQKRIDFAKWLNSKERVG